MKSILQRLFAWLFSEQIAKEKEAIKKEIDYLKIDYVPIALRFVLRVIGM